MYTSYGEIAPTIPPPKKNKKIKIKKIKLTANILKQDLNTKKRFKRTLILIGQRKPCATFRGKSLSQSNVLTGKG